MAVDGVVQDEDPALSEQDTKVFFSWRLDDIGVNTVDRYFSCNGNKQLSSLSPKLSLI